MFKISKDDAETVIEVLDLEIRHYRNRLAQRRMNKTEQQMCKDHIAKLYEAKRRLELQLPVDLREAS